MKQLAIAEDNCELLWIGTYCARGPLLMVFVLVKITCGHGICFRTLAVGDTAASQNLKAPPWPPTGRPQVA